MSTIPPRQRQVEDKERRFYVCAPSSIYLQLQQEAIQRGSDLWTLGGSVLTAWLEAGCPSFGPQAPGLVAVTGWSTVRKTSGEDDGGGRPPLDSKP